MGASALDDLRHRDRLAALGVDQPRSGLSVHGPGGVTRPGERPLTSGAVPRGFSFSLTDMPDPHGIRSGRGRAIGTPHGGPYAQEPGRQTGPTWQRWNPMEGIKRHWAETPDEAKLNLPHAGGITPYGNLSHMPYEKALQELNRTEGHVEALRMKIAHLESGLLSGFPGEGQFKVVVPFLPDGSLGLTLRGTTVTGIVDPRSEAFGWCVGDRILKLNELPVSTGPDFQAELQRATAAHRVSGRPLVFDVFRPSSLGTAAPYYAHGGLSRSLSPHRFLPPFQGPMGSPLVPHHAFSPRTLSPLQSHHHPMVPPVLPHTMPLTPHTMPLSMPFPMQHPAVGEAQNHVLRSQTNVLSHENAVLRTELAAARAREAMHPLGTVATFVAPPASQLATAHAPMASVLTPVSMQSPTQPTRSTSPGRELPRTRIMEAGVAPPSVATATTSAPCLQAQARLPARASSPTYHSASAPATAPRLNTFVAAMA